DWIEQKKRIFLHFIPTSSSWLNLVERFFCTLTQKQLRRGVFCSVVQLEQCIQNYIATHNENLKPSIWTKSVDEILDKVGRVK
ncbi:MAG: IS630 family transposase, partial [Bacteroidetes bacterium]|nr:IS630 family transposase [Bacteroidota bacterium]